MQEEIHLKIINFNIIQLIKIFKVYKISIHNNLFRNKIVNNILLYFLKINLFIKIQMKTNKKFTIKYNIK